MDLVFMGEYSGSCCIFNSYSLAGCQGADY